MGVEGSLPGPGASVPSPQGPSLPDASLDSASAQISFLVSSCQPRFSLSSVQWPMGRAGIPVGWRKETPRTGPQPSQRTPRRASLKMPSSSLHWGALGGIPGVSPSARVEPGCAQEPGASWSGFPGRIPGWRILDSSCPAAPLSERRGTLQAGEGASASSKSPGRENKQELSPTLPPNLNLEGHWKLGAAHSCQGLWSSWRKNEEGQMGGGSEDPVEPAGQGLAGGASLRARLLMSPVCSLGSGDLPGQDQAQAQAHGMVSGAEPHSGCMGG